jgi:alkanesulfonate monooxygenase SsuD/methylene tetrahydromethanopterin reductase-like flavin-dependent oxidoreductase (luciferase family)
VEEPFLDAWTILPAVAAVTSRIRLGAMVSPVGYRNPALLARMAASLDHISNGRMNFGFGAGGFKPEYQAYLRLKRQPMIWSSARRQKRR